MATEPTPISPLPTPPTRTMARAQFVVAINDWFAGWPTFRTQFNTSAAVTYTNAVEAAASAAAAESAKTLAEAAALAALNDTNYVGTSTTSLAVGTGSKAFTTQSGLAFAASGDRVTAASRGSTAKMRGVATYSGTTLTIAVDQVEGSGTHSDWMLVLSALEVPTARERLTADRTYYVRSDGNDANDGLTDSAGGAFLTIQKAVNVAAAVDWNGYAVTIQVKGGTFSGAVEVNSLPFQGSNLLTITGDTTTPANAVLTSTGATTITVRGARVKVQGFKFTTTGQRAILATEGAYVEYSAVEFAGGGIGVVHVKADTGATIWATDDYTISNGASAHWETERGGNIIVLGGMTITLTGTPAFTQFALATMISTITVGSVTFSGSASGIRYSVTTNSVINVNGAGTSFLPGDSAGSTGTGGQFL